MPWVFLSIAIAAEIVGTLSLKASAGFTRPGFSALTVIGYGIAFYLLSLVLKSIPVGIAYAVWAGAGVAAVAILGVLLFGQKLDLAAVVGIALIVTGVVVLNTLSGTVTH